MEHERMTETDHPTAGQAKVQTGSPRSVSGGMPDRNSACILVVTSRTNPVEQVTDYVISVADRLGSKVVLARVNRRPLLRENSPICSSRISAARWDKDAFREKAEGRGVECECIVESGKIGKVVSRLCHIIKRVEFVVIDQGIKMEEVVAGSPVPVFSVVGRDQGRAGEARNRQTRTPFHGETFMKTASRRTYYVKTLIFGAMTVALYTAVFAYSDTIMQYWTKGGIYALLPVATVFVFSYAHGSFTGNFWSALGIEGSKKVGTATATQTRTVVDTAQKRPDTRPRVQASL